jgi:hypothetical protein
LIFLFIWQLVGSHLFFQVERFHIRKDIKKAIKHSLPDKSYKEFNFTFKEFNQLAWINDHEFKMDGRMYDVVKKKKNNIGYSVSCIDDVQETVLFAKLDEATASNMHNQPEKSPFKSFMKMFKTSFIVHESHNDSFEEISFASKKEFFHYNFIFAQFKIAAQLQPPQFLV